jgi:hypothetical protein
MRYALCYRGISYCKDYIHQSNEKPEPYDIDFEPCIFHAKENIIKPIKESGNDIDIFFNTYDSEKLSLYRNLLTPVYTRLSEFNFNGPQNNWVYVFKMLLDCCYMVKEYEVKKNIKYDYIILTRFDYVFIEKITNLYIPENAVSATTEGEDHNYFISRDMLDIFISTLLQYQYSTDTHQILKLLHNNGHRCHILYPQTIYKDDFNRPLGRLARHLFTKDGHSYKQYNIEDTKNPNSKFYCFINKPNKEFTPPKY